MAAALVLGRFIGHSDAFLPVGSRGLVGLGVVLVLGGTDREGIAA